MAPILASTDASVDFMAYENIIWAFPGYELSFGTLDAKVGQLWVENNCVRHTNTTLLVCR